MNFCPGHRLFSVLFHTLLLTALFTWNSHAFAGEQLSIVFREDLPIHSQLAEKLKKSIQQQDSSLTVQLFSLPREWSPASQKKLLQQNPSRFLAIGDVALSFCIETAPELPGTYFMLTSKEVAIKVAGKWQWEGTKIWVEPSIQFALIRELLPNIKKIGMVLTPDCKDCGDLFVATAQKYGLELNYELAEGRQQIIPAMREVFHHSDAYLLLPDANLLNNITIQELLRLQHETQRPLIGPAMPFVRMGAMMSINYKVDNLVEYIAANIRTNIDPDEKWQQITECCINISANKKVVRQLDIRLQSKGLENKINLIDPEVEL